MRAVSQIYDPSLSEGILRASYEHVLRTPAGVDDYPGDYPARRKRTFTIGDGDDFVSVRLVEGSRGHRGCEVMFMNGPLKPCYSVGTSGGRIWSNGLSYGEVEDAALKALRLLTEGYMIYKVEMPYGYVDQRGVISLIIWSNLGEGVPGSVFIGSGHYVLRDHYVPTALQMADGDGRSYMERFWSLRNRSGKPRLIELGHQYPRLISHITNGGNIRPYLVFDSSSSRSPGLQAGIPYYLGHPRGDRNVAEASRRAS